MRYEMKKLLRRREVWIVLALSLIAVLLLNCREPWAGVHRRALAKQKLAVYGDMPPEEAAPLLTREWEQLGGYGISMTSPKYDEWLVLRDLRESAVTYLEHEKNMRTLIAKMYTDLEHAATAFERRDIAHAIRLYNHKTQYQLCLYAPLDFTMLNVEYNNSIHNLYLLILCTLLAPLFAAEHETGMYQVLFISKKGKAGLFRKKIGGGMLCAALFAFCYTAVTFAIVWVKFGLPLRLLTAPVQCAEMYRNCPYAVSILTFVLMTAAMRALVGALLTALTALISCRFRRTLAVFGTTAAAAAIPILLSALFTDIPAGQMILKRLGLMRLPHLGDYLTQYDTVNVFGFPVMQLWLSVGCTCGMILCILTAAYAIYTKQQTQNGRRVKSC